MNKKSYKYISSSIEKYNGNYDLIKSDLYRYVNGGKTVILCIDSKDVAKRIVKYLEMDDIVLTDVKNIIPGKINLINQSIVNGFIFECNFNRFGIS